MGVQVNTVLKSLQLIPDLIASHSYTVFHQPESNLTVQIGSGAAIYAKCNVPVIFDFRSLDVALGGQGAPLVPIGDEILFADYAACPNLGGIANISTEFTNQRIAYDIVPVNMVLNHLMRPLGKSYDNKGALAASGRVLPEVLSHLEGLSYFSAPPPKSLGYEWMQEHVLPLIDNTLYNIEDLLRTYVEHASLRISYDIKNKVLPNAKILPTGGGAFNDFFIQKIDDHLSRSYELILPSSEVIEFKEAIIFAFLGYLKATKQPNALSSVTGAKRNSSGGLVIDG